MKLHPYRRPAILVLALNLNACTTWEPTPVSPQQMLRESQIRITRTDGTLSILPYPIVRNDSIVGTYGRDPRPIKIGGVATGEIATVEVRRFDRRRTLAAVVTITAGLVVLWLTSSGEPGDFQGGNLPRPPPDEQLSRQHFDALRAWGGGLGRTGGRSGW